MKEDKGDKFGNYQCPKNNYEIDQMMSMPYALTIESIMYDQTCTCPDLAFTTGMFGRYQTHKALKSSSDSQIFTRNKKPQTYMHIEDLVPLR